MKKIINYKNKWGVLLVILSLLSSCKQDLDIWDSETLEYSGTYFWRRYNEDMSKILNKYNHENQILIYNTAENKTNNVWIKDTKVFPLKSKFTFSGSSKSFTSTELDFDNLEYNVSAINLPVTSGPGQEEDTNGTPVEEPTNAGENVSIPRSYIKNAVLEGKILPNAGKTVSGNPVDSIYIKLKTFSGNVNFTSYEVPVEQRKDPSVVEYAWKFNDALYDSSKDKVYIISGHRKTGFAEDDH